MVVGKQLKEVISTLRLSLTRVRIKESLLRILLHIPKEFLVVYDFVLFVESCSKNTGAWSLVSREVLGLV